ncbi:MAG: CTP synthase [Pyramidobacter sp.]|uniref:CTP synthase n=1 Tax=Pyramidobacter sp. TaxID=1943581 RepID=UPI0025FA92B9|nr:CTP synthase [Pyramidobacter sp.]MCI7403558.1 CTP synthase [Pyramidobacter sp.]
MAKYVFVTGGVVSSLGKGITAASLGMLLKQRGLNVGILKMDPYLNVDAGTMSPFQHGEVFVTDDGAETDLDLGHYERFIDENLSGANSCTSGKVYLSVISNERRGDYDGRTVQVIPHVTDEILRRITALGAACDVLISEIGGTVGDIEGQPFLEAIRQLPARVGKGNVLYCHVTLLPYIGASGELKTKPTQHSVNELRRLGIQPDVIVCRSPLPVTAETREKIALFCSVPPQNVIEERDADTIYRVPEVLRAQNFDALVLRCLGLDGAKEPDRSDWSQFLRRRDAAAQTVTSALVGKYTENRDAYLSVNEALSHAAIANGAAVTIVPVDSETLTPENVDETLACADGILVPGGFGARGIPGKILAARFARVHDVPYLGICLGMQVAAIEFARGVLGLAEADSCEFNPDTPDPVIHLMETQKGVAVRGGTMRLGAYPCDLVAGSKARDEIYRVAAVSERHRHRFEFNERYRARYEAAGMKVAGVCPSGGQVEIMENVDCRWFVGVQFHPEFKSRPIRPHPLFASFIAAAMKKQPAAE